MPEERRLVTVLFADFLVTGDAVNVAARPQQAAEPWAILCGERTARAAGDGFEMGPRVGFSADLDELAVARYAHGGCILDVNVLRPVIARAAELGFASLEAQARRALGIALDDPEEVERAATIFERTGMAAYAARARCEDALLVGDGRELDAGLAVLDRLGDLEGPARYRRRL